ncbi:MAG TPA: NHL repeat-containing protein [Dehalococcoidia bacterium]|nr:NHL repeat-containing protein [Dehalococcoidia bacterium]
MTTQTQEKPLSARGLYRYHDVIGLLSAGGAGFSNPVSIALGPDNLLYVLSRANPNQPEAVRVSRCTKDGEYVSQFGEWGDAEGQFTWVTDLAFSRRGELFVADEHAHRISIFTPEGQFQRCFGQQGHGAGDLDRPSGLAFDRDDNLYVVDTLNHRVQRLTQQGRSLGRWGSQGSGPGQFNMPWGIAIDRQGHLYVTDWRNDRVQKFSPAGKFLLAFGRSGAGDGELDRPTGIAVDGGGDIYVCDWRNDRVQVFDPQGGYKDTLIGHGGISQWARGYLAANPEVEMKLNRATQNIEPKKRFYRPASVKVDGDGKVYVVDCYRHRVQIYQKVSALAG